MQKGGDLMNNIELQKFIEVVQANERLKNENFDLRNKNSELKREIATIKLKDTLNSGVPVVYADTDSLKVMKEGEA